MTMKKQDLYNFIKTKRTNTILEKVRPLEDELDKKKKDYARAKLTELGFYKLDKNILNEYDKFVKNLRDELTYHSYEISRLSSAYNDSTKEDFWINLIIGKTNIDLIDDLTVLNTKARKMRSEILEEFEKINNVVKSKSNAKQGYKFLKEIGFDVSSIEIIEKNEIANINVNSELLGLPETKEEIKGGFGEVND